MGGARKRSRHPDEGRGGEEDDSWGRASRRVDASSRKRERGERRVGSCGCSFASCSFDPPEKDPRAIWGGEESELVRKMSFGRKGVEEDEEKIRTSRRVQNHRPISSWVSRSLGGKKNTDYSHKIHVDVEKMKTWRKSVERGVFQREGSASPSGFRKPSALETRSKLYIYKTRTQQTSTETPSLRAPTLI